MANILGGQPDQALHAFNRAVEQDPGVDTLLARGQFQFLRDDLKAAESDFLAVTQLKRQHPEALQMLLRISLEREAEADGGEVEKPSNQEFLRDEFFEERVKL